MGDADGVVADHRIRGKPMKRGRIVAWIVAIVVTVAGFQIHSGDLARINRQATKACSFERRSWNTQRSLIRSDAVPQKPSEAVLQALPEFAPFFTPGNPLYDAQVRALNTTRDRRLRVLGDRPSC